MNFTRREALLSLIPGIAVLMPGCNSSEVVVSLELAVDALTVAVAVFGQAIGLPSSLQGQIETYLIATSQAISTASGILADYNLTDAGKAVQIVSVFAGIAVPIVPPQYQAIATAVSQVAALVAAFLLKAAPAEHFTNPAPTTTTQISKHVRYYQPKKTPLTRANLTKLIDIRAKSEGDLLKLRR